MKATDDVEIRELIRILVLLGTQKQSKVNLTTIWEPLIGQDFVQATMSKNRCFQLLNTLRFDNKDKLEEGKKLTNLLQSAKFFTSTLTTSKSTLFLDLH
ncbi:hypothetical protein PoB_001979200 [Plakobranchus ocellatus]|uniref:PiggyBac transposable element-derived protein domain-containing protein n=1 Tax=Plakobranchus ocellatus TaxID=259542 RepID=A0AAV3ZDC4_9GAST|nr:hypothetical protein PoB_001979200 [Plakobranchus ocellatus]